MNLTIQERLILGGVLPERGNYTTMIAVKEIKELTAITKEEIEFDYFSCRKSIAEIAKDKGVSISYLCKLFRKYGIVGRKGPLTQTSVLFGDNNCLYTDKEWLFEKYVLEKKTALEIAHICFCCKSTVKRWLKKFGIAARSNSDSHKGRKRSLDSRRKQSISVSGPRNHFYGKHHSYEMRQRQRERFLGDRGTRFNKSPEWKWCVYVDKLGRTHHFQSSWEQKYAKYLDGAGILWVSHRGIRRFRYIDDAGVVKTYAPDFYLPGTDEYIEIKGYFPTTARRKMEIVMKTYTEVKFVILEQKQLKDMGVL
jgi:transposase